MNRGGRGKQERHLKISPPDETILLRIEARWLAKRAEVAEAKGENAVAISPSLARRLSDHLFELERLREAAQRDH